MSSINFRTKTRSARVNGIERHRAKAVCESTTMSAFDLAINRYAPEESVLCRVLPAGCNPSQLSEYLRLSMVVSDSILVGDRRFDMFYLSLNTSPVLGSDLVKLLARLHGQCEIHCWVAAEHTRWLAGIIRNGVEKHLLRNDTGWDGVIELLESGDENVVTDYSVTEIFPNPHIAGWVPPVGEDGKPDRDAWYELSREEQWEMAMRGLRQEKGLELTPDDWASLYFADGSIAFDLIEACASSAPSIHKK